MKVQSEAVCFRVYIQDHPSVQTSLIPDLWPWHILAVGCVVLGSCFPTLCKTTVKRQIWPGNFSAKEKWAKPEKSAKCCKHRFIDRKIPQKGKIVSFLSLHFPIFPTVFICFSLVSASLLFICLILAFHVQMYFDRRCRDSTGLTWVQHSTRWEVFLRLSLQKWVPAIQDMHRKPPRVDAFFNSFLTEERCQAIKTCLYRGK